MAEAEGEASSHLFYAPKMILRKTAAQPFPMPCLLRQKRVRLVVWLSFDSWFLVRLLVSHLMGEAPGSTCVGLVLVPQRVFGSHDAPHDHGGLQAHTGSAFI